MDPKPLTQFGVRTTQYTATLNLMVNKYVKTTRRVVTTVFHDPLNSQINQ